MSLLCAGAMSELVLVLVLGSLLVSVLASVSVLVLVFGVSVEC